MDLKLSFIEKELSSWLSNFRKNGLYPIHYYNFWTDQLAREMWLSQFIESRGLLQKNRRINFSSVLGEIENVKLRKGSNIFFSGENMQADRFKEYRDKVKELEFDLYIDFDTTLDTNKAIRFPLWLLYVLEPDSNTNDIKKKVAELKYPVINTERSKFCSLVSSHDLNGIRGEIIDKVSVIDTVYSGGKFRKNTDDLTDKYKNNKHDFIKQYKFNICPENSNSEGYTTEKIFQAIIAGCIPIYWGNNNSPELGILNQKRILFWEQGKQNSQLIEKINKLQQDYQYYLDFISQPCFVDGAEDIIVAMFDELEKRIRYTI